MITESACPSTYTIDRRTGEKLTCTMEQHAAPGFRGVVHSADAYGVGWYWNDREADK